MRRRNLDADRLRLFCVRPVSVSVRSMPALRRGHFGERRLGGLQDLHDSLPVYAHDYIYGRLFDVLSGKDQSQPYAHLSAADRQAVMEILKATKPAFAKVAAAKSRH